MMASFFILGGLFRQAERPVLARANEVDDLHQFRAITIGLLGVFYALAECAFLGKKHPVGRAKIMDGLTAEPAPFHAHDVETGEVGMVTDDRTIGNDVSDDDGPTTDEGVLPNAAELVNSSEAAHPDLISNHDMAAKRNIVRENALVADDTIMGDVNADHEQTVFTDLGESTMRRRATMNGYMFADDR